MSEPHLDLADLIPRVVHLERRQRLVQPLTGLAMLATLAALAAFAPAVPDTVQAQRVELVNRKGETRAALVADITGVVLTLFDEHGRASASLRLNTDPRLAVIDGAGHEVVGLGAPRAQNLAQ